MAKTKIEELPPEPKGEPQPDPVIEEGLKAFDAAPVLPVRPLWTVKKRGVEGEPQLMEADSLEDVVRIFNGERTMYSAGQLEITKV